jgi:hypothetical protein
VTAESLPPELVALHDQPGGTSLRGLAGILNAYDALRAEQVSHAYREWRLRFELDSAHSVTTCASVKRLPGGRYLHVIHTLATEVEYLRALAEKRGATDIEITNRTVTVLHADWAEADLATIGTRP